MYVLDTNVVIDIFRPDRVAVRTAYAGAIAKNSKLVISSITLFELNVGIAKSNDPANEMARIATFLSGHAAPLDFTSQDAEVAGHLRAKLERAGTPIGPYDVLIAAQALRRDVTLVSADLAEFGRIPGLKVVSWR